MPSHTNSLYYRSNHTITITKKFKVTEPKALIASNYVAFGGGWSPLFSSKPLGLIWCQKLKTIKKGNPYHHDPLSLSLTHLLELVPYN